jgi:uncharacterized protein YggE
MLRIALSALVLASLLAASAGAQTAAPAPPEIATTASAEQRVPADLAVVSVRFSRMGRTPAAAGRALGLKADSIRTALAALGVPRDSVVNGSRWYWWRGRIELVETALPPEEIVHTDERGNRIVRQIHHRDTTYRAHEQLQVRVRDVPRVGRVIDALLAQGVVEIGDVAFSATDTETARREAIREATERARARAQVIAEAGGGRLGRTLRLSTDGNGEVRQFDYLGLVTTSMGTEQAPAAGATVVVAPVLTVSATVHGRWEFAEVPL